MSKAIDGEVSHHTDKYRDIFPRAVIKQNISRGTKEIAVNVYNLSDLIAVTWAEFVESRLTLTQD